MLFTASKVIVKIILESIKEYLRSFTDKNTVVSPLDPPSLTTSTLCRSFWNMSLDHHCTCASSISKRQGVYLKYSIQMGIPEKLIATGSATNWIVDFCKVVPCRRLFMTPHAVLSRGCGRPMISFFTYYQQSQTSQLAL